MRLNMKYWPATLFPKLKTLIHNTIFVKNDFYSSTIKMKMDSSQWGKIWCNVNETNNSIEINQKRHRGIENFLSCAPMFLFFPFCMKLKAFRVTQNDTPILVKMSVFTNNLSHFFVNTSPLNAARRYLAKYVPVDLVLE